MRRAGKCEELKSLEVFSNDIIDNNTSENKDN